MDGDSVTLSNPYSMGIIPSDDQEPLVVIRSKDMIVKSLEKELWAINMQRLRKIAHKVYGKGSWIASVHKDDLIKRFMADKHKHSQIRETIQENQRETDLEKSVFTPEIKHLCALLAIKIGQRIVQHLKGEQVKEDQ